MVYFSLIQGYLGLLMENWQKLLIIGGLGITLFLISRFKPWERILSIANRLVPKNAKNSYFIAVVLALNLIAFFIIGGIVYVIWAILRFFVIG